MSEDGEEDHAQAGTPFGVVLRKVSIFFYALSLAVVIAWEAVQLAAPNGSAGKNITISLTRGSFTVIDFPVHHGVPRAVVLFGTGDGGWSPFEEAISRTLQKSGYEAVGIDFYHYAKADYDLATLQSDMNQVAQTIRKRYGSNPPPVILGGYSMGAAQAIAAAGGPHPPQGLVGLLVVDPLRRGRYGLRLLDEGNLPPTGPGTFSMSQFSGTMKNLRVVQWHATEDGIDSRDWLKSLTAEHKEFDFGQSGHYYTTDRDDFLSQFGRSVEWIFNPAKDPVMATGSRS